jgi:hypothetical protein
VVAVAAGMRAERRRCGHGQHVRHDPPWQVRQWVTTEAGRASFLGVELECVLCDALR